MSKKKDPTPAEVKAARRAKARRRLWVGGGFFALWWVLFLTGLATGMDVFIWAGWIALSGQLIALYGLHEKALRRIANRPAVDYGQLARTENQLRKAEARIEKARPSEIKGGT
jgi:hypothetical protein